MKPRSTGGGTVTVAGGSSMTKKRRYRISAAFLAACVCETLGLLAMLSHKNMTRTWI